jgi:hypothetical protein
MSLRAEGPRQIAVPRPGSHRSAALIQAYRVSNPQFLPVFTCY